jgi:hypothetical protein
MTPPSVGAAHARTHQAAPPCATASPYAATSDAAAVTAADHTSQRRAATVTLTILRSVVFRERYGLHQTSHSACNSLGQPGCGVGDGDGALLAAEGGGQGVVASAAVEDAREEREADDADLGW